MGETYREVVLKCLTGDSLQEEPGSSAEMENSADTLPSRDKLLKLLSEAYFARGFECDPIRFYWAVVRELEKCHCGNESEVA